MDIRLGNQVSKTVTTYEAPVDANVSQSVGGGGTSAVSEKKGDIHADGKYSKEFLEKEINGLNKWLETKTTHLKFNLHNKLNEYYVQVLDDKTNEVIREVPSKKLMDMVANMYEMAGILLDEKR